MANTGWIDINTAVKPYSRKFIAQQLDIITSKRDSLNPRQQKDLAFYLKDYNKEIIKVKGQFEKRKDLYYYGDSLFQFTLNPIAGTKDFFSNKSYSNNWGGIDLPHRIVGADAFHRYAGAEFFASIGSHFGISASLRDNGISQDLLSYGLLVNKTGGIYKLTQSSTNAYDFSESYGSVAYDWSWGSVALRKDNFTWGNNYNGANIFSARNPSYGYLHLKLNPAKWFDFNFIHGALVSQEIDSAATYWVNGQRRRMYYDKYIAANFYTIRPTKNTYLSFGNSVVYSDIGINPAYLIPFMFYKSVDHTYNGAGSNDVGQNAQMFLDLSTRAIKYTHLYYSLYLDELNMGNMFDKDKQTNLYSMKLGFKVSNLIPNASITAEYTKTHPWTYRHQIARTTYASNYYNLGHYLGENSDELYLALDYKPIRTLNFTASYTKARKGPEHVYALIYGNANVTGLKFMEYVVWSSTQIAFKVNYEVINDAYLYLQAVKSTTSGLTTQYSPDIFNGNTTAIILGANFGF